MPALVKEESVSGPAFSRLKHVLPEEAQSEAFPNSRYHYSLLGFLQKRRGGGGARKKSGGSSGFSSSGELDRGRP